MTTKRLRLMQGCRSDQVDVDAWVEIDSEGRAEFYVSGRVLDVSKEEDQLEGPTLHFKVERAVFDAVVSAKLVQQLESIAIGLDDLRLPVSEFEQSLREDR